MGPEQYGDLDATRPKAEFLRSNKEYCLSHDEDIVSREDLIEADELAYDRERVEWAFEVIGSCGFPRKRIGVFVIRLRDDGQLVTYLE